MRCVLSRIAILVSVACLIWTCTPENEEITWNPDVKLFFSTDTLFFDTVFTTVGSVTQRLKIYNPSKHAVSIQEIALGTRDASAFTLHVNGKQGQSFEDVLILGSDSLLALVEVLVNPLDENLPFLVQDSIRFRVNGNLQDVKLMAWGQDACFIKKSTLSCDTVWSSQKPIVLLDTVVVDSACTLTIKKGTRIYANRGAALLVAGNLHVIGTADERVLFTSSRLDIKDAWGQWGGLVFLQNSRNNAIDFATIRNGIFGVYIGAPDNDTIPDLIISNTIIENAASAGLICFNSDVSAFNVLINSCGQFTAAMLAGGSYSFRHCTFSNFTRDINPDRVNPSVAFSNYYAQDDLEINEKLRVDLQNSIVWGNLRDEILLNAEGDAGFEAAIAACLLKTENGQLDINGNILNKDPLFVDPVRYNYRPDTLSPVLDAGDAAFSVPFDLDGMERDDMPDIGAYERIVIE